MLKTSCLHLISASLINSLFSSISAIFLFFPPDWKKKNHEQAKWLEKFCALGWSTSSLSSRKSRTSKVPLCVFLSIELHHSCWKQETILITPIRLEFILPLAHFNLYSRLSFSQGTAQSHLAENNCYHDGFLYTDSFPTCSTQQCSLSPNQSIIWLIHVHW